jgi:hypothetical protein
MSTYTTTVLDNVELVSLDISLWSGRKKLRPDDIKLGVGGQLPPDKVASLGSKKIIDPKSINTFARIKRAAERLLESTGVRFLGGYALAIDKVAEVLPQLDKLQAEFLAEKQAFLADYDRRVNAWIAQHPGFEQALRNAITPLDYVRAQLGFGYTVFQVGVSRTGAGDLDRQAATLGDRLLDEVARDARELLEQSIATRDEASQKAKRPLLRMREKLASLAFLAAEADPLVDAIDQVIGALPKNGPIGGRDLLALTSLVTLLGRPDEVRKHLAAQRDLVSIIHQDFVPSLGPVQSTTPAAAEVVSFPEPESEPEEPATEEPAEVEYPERPAAAAGSFFF